MRKLLLILYLVSLSANAYSNALINSNWGKIAAEKGLDPFELYAVSLMESSKYSSNNTITPWPLAINAAGTAIFPRNRGDALNALACELEKGITSIDVGLMQINIKWNGYRVSDIKSLFDPEVNLRVGADILAEAIRSEPHDKTLGLGRYHAGYGNEPDRLARAYAYGRRISLIANRLRKYFGD
ncbi:transglycosylase SLT domain-containing protein [Methylomonas sp. OY6]|uniref:Transglycosylase SLT domain-containing protein n=1 Tax=Methylomonas defluvii TaxID=3045149 RepID=A0ABU4UCA7_9GAMM|nr:transglycosylase SLT domain-containing protein [Methylomonas sp. OY6]MDX8126969.1 transglycosylase SLT domain-containing protein [Methylomonas sp. OY6]